MVESAPLGPLHTAAMLATKGIKVDGCVYNQRGKAVITF